MPAKIPIDREALAAFCQKHRIRRLSLFGSVVRDDFDPKRSDVDVLVEFEPGVERGMTYFRLAGIQQELSELFGRSAEVVLASSLDRYLRQDILNTAEVQFDAA